MLSGDGFYVVLNVPKSISAGFPNGPNWGAYSAPADSYSRRGGGSLPLPRTPTNLSPLVIGASTPSADVATPMSAFLLVDRRLYGGVVVIVSSSTRTVAVRPAVGDALTTTTTGFVVVVVVVVVARRVQELGRGRRRRDGTSYVVTQASFTGDARRRLREADDEQAQDEVDHFPVETIEIGGVLGSEHRLRMKWITFL